MCVEPGFTYFWVRVPHALLQAPGQYRPHILVRGLERFRTPTKGSARRDVLFEAAFSYAGLYMSTYK